jgi:hypothetical protein
MEDPSTPTLHYSHHSVALACLISLTKKRSCPSTRLPTLEVPGACFRQKRPSCSMREEGAGWLPNHGTSAGPPQDLQGRRVDGWGKSSQCNLQQTFTGPAPVVQRTSRFPGSAIAAAVRIRAGAGARLPPSSRRPHPIRQKTVGMPRGHPQSACPEGTRSRQKAVKQEVPLIRNSHSAFRNRTLFRSSIRLARSSGRPGNRPLRF